MQAIELVGDIDEHHRLQARVPEGLPATEAERSKNDIPVDEGNWKELCETAVQSGVRDVPGRT
jgi:hypothetical protein